MNNQGKKGRNYQGFFFFFELTEQEQLEDGWRKWNSDLNFLTFYSASKKSFTRIDMIWISKSLETLTKRIEILPKELSDHNPVLWVGKIKIKRSHWHANEDLLYKKENIEHIRNETKIFLI